MDFSKTIKEELEGKIKSLDDLIANKGFGSGRLSKAKKMQRNVNLAVILGSLLAVAGVAFWAFNRNHD